MLASATEDLETDVRIIALDALGRTDEALALARLPTPRISRDDNAAAMRLALRHYLEGDVREALANLDESVGVDPANDKRLPAFPDGEDVFWTARFYTRLGRTDLGLLGFRATVEQGYFCVTQFEREPWLDALRSDPAFVETMQLARTRRQQTVEIFELEGGPALLAV